MSVMTEVPQTIMQSLARLDQIISRSGTVNATILSDRGMMLADLDAQAARPFAKEGR